jgi:hypothetical protein
MRRWRGRRFGVHRIPPWSIAAILCLLQSFVWLWLYRKVRKRTVFFFHDAATVDVPLLDAVFLSDLDRTCGGAADAAADSRVNPRRCSSPECASPWPLGSCDPRPQHDDDGNHPGNNATNTAHRRIVGRSHTSRRTCGWCSNGPREQPSRLAGYLRALSDRLADRHADECGHRVVVYSVALGVEHEQFLWDMPHPYNATTRLGTKLDAADLLRRHGNCFFTFVLRNTTITTTASSSSDTSSSGGSAAAANDQAPRWTPTRSADGIDWVVAIPTDILPYRNHRRNTKLIKLQGHMIFPWAQRLIWQDTKFRRFDFSHARPTDYERWFNDHVVGSQNNNNHGHRRSSTTNATTAAANAVCAGFYALPSHENSFGQYVAAAATADNNNHERHQRPYRNQYLHHCETVVEALKIRHTVTDSRSALLHQCRAYVRQSRMRFDADLLSLALIDSAFMGWDLRQEHCRAFVADLTCTWLDELHCYSDRDQISFPQVIRSMQLRPLHRQYVDPVTTNVEFWSHGRPMARFTQSRCHWYYQEIDECYH